MEIGEGLRTFLLVDPGIAAVVGTRVYPVVLPQGLAQPAIRLTLISGQRVHASPQGGSMLSGPRIQLDAWAPSYASAYALAELIRKRINGYRGLMDAVPVQGVFFADERDGFDAESKLYFVSRDYFVFFEET
jgi:hypothetical protein